MDFPVLALLFPNSQLIDSLNVDSLVSQDEEGEEGSTSLTLTPLGASPLSLRTRLAQLEALTTRDAAQEAQLIRQHLKQASRGLQTAANSTTGNTRQANVITTKWPARCKQCNKFLPAGTEVSYDRTAKEVRCTTHSK